MIGELVKTKTKDKLILNGFYLSGDKSKPLIIHIHGYEGDFYSNNFVHAIGNKLNNNGFGFLTVETRGSYHLREFNIYQGGYKTYGAQIEKLEEAYLDIDAWVQFAIKLGYQSIILQGHSLGTFKSVRYLMEGKNVNYISKLILICPFDKTFNIDTYSKGKYLEYVDISKTQIDSNNGEAIVPKIYSHIPISYQTYASWYQEDELSHMFDMSFKSYNFLTLNKINIPVHVVVGSEDEYFYQVNPKNPQEGLNILLNNLRIGTGNIIDGAKHGFKGFEEELATDIESYVSKK